MRGVQSQAVITATKLIPPHLKPPNASRKFDQELEHPVPFVLVITVGLLKMAALLSSLHTSLSPLLHPSHPLRQPSARPIPASDLAQEISTIWSESSPVRLPDSQTISDSASEEEKKDASSNKKRRERAVDMLRGVLDVAGRDIIIGPVASGEVRLFTHIDGGGSPVEMSKENEAGIELMGS